MSSEKSSPRGKVALSPLNLDNKVNKIMKYDLGQLEKVSNCLINGNVLPINTKKYQIK
jgi:hypothetical protein